MPTPWAPKFARGVITNIVVEENRLPTPFGMSDDSDDGADNADQQAALNNIVQPLRKLIKKQSSKIDKLSKVASTLEEERAKEAALREEMERQLSELKATGTTLKATLDQNPWRYQNEQTEATVRALEKRLTDSLDEQRH